MNRQLRQLRKRALYTLLPTCAVTMGIMFAVIASAGNLVSMAHASASYSSQKQHTFSVSTSIHPTLIIRARAGSIQVNVGRAGHIVVKYTIHHSGPGRAPVVSFAQNMRANSVTVIETEYSQPAKYANQHTDFVITVPRNTDLDFSTGAGPISVMGVSSRLQLHTGAGDVTARMVVAKGNSALSTHAGSVVLSGNIQPGSFCKLSANAGSLVADLPGSANVSVSASLLAGIISSDFSGISIDRNSASGTIGSAPYAQLSMTVQAGTISINRL